MEGRAAVKLRAGFDPRRPIQRDRFNEYFVFLLSATGAAVVVPLILLVVAIAAGEFGVLLFVALSVALELILIFGIGRPQMKPHERLGWALLWGTAAAFFGLCFYYLVVQAVL